MNLVYYLVIGILVLWTVLWFRFDFKSWWNTGGNFGEGFKMPDTALALIKHTPVKPRKNYVLQDANKFTKWDNYALSFTIKPLSKQAGWRGIIHNSMTGGNCCHNYERWPGIWFFHNTTRMHIRWQNNKGVDPSYHLPLGQKSTVTATVDNATVRVVIRDENDNIKFDQSSTLTAHNPPVNPTSQKFYMCGPWYNPADVEITELILDSNVSNPTYKIPPTLVGKGKPQWAKIPGKLKNVSSNTQGYVWGVSDSSRIYRRDPGGKNWKLVPGGLEQISVGDKNVYGVNRVDAIYKRTVDGTGNWKSIPGRLTNISGSGSGWIWGVNTHNNIYARPKEDKAKSIGWGGWHHIHGKLKQISGGQNEVWGVNTHDNIYKRPIEPIVWKRICPSAGAPGGTVSMRMVVVDGNYVYGCATNNHIYKCPVNGATQWSLIPNSSAVFNIAVAGGYIYGIGMSKGLWKRPTTGTQKFKKIASCCVTQIVVYGGYVYGIGTNRWIYRVSTNGGTWSRDLGGHHSCCVTNIAIAGGNIYGVGTNKALYKRPINGKWKKIASCCVTQIVVHGNYVYGVGTNRWIYRVSTNGGKWQRVNPSSCCVVNIAISGGNIYAVGTDKRLWKRPLPDTKNNWKRISGKLKWVSASNPDYVYGVNSADHIYKCKKPCTGQWSRVPGRLKQISVGQQVWGIGNVPDNIYSSNYGGAAPVAAGGSSCVPQFRSGKAGEKMHGPWFGGQGCQARCPFLWIAM